MEYFNGLDTEVVKKENGKLTFKKPKIGQIIYVLPQTNHQNGVVPMEVCGYNKDGTISVEHNGEERTAKAVISCNNVLRWIDVMD